MFLLCLAVAQFRGGTTIYLSNRRKPKITERQGYFLFVRSSPAQDLLLERCLGSVATRVVGLAWIFWIYGSGRELKTDLLQANIQCVCPA